MSIVEVTDLVVRRGTKTVLSGTSFSLKEGRCLAVVGESGSGKSTLLQTLCGFVPIETGHVSLFGKRFDQRHKIRPGQNAQQMQMVFQDPNSSVDPRWTAGQIVTECLRGVSKSERLVAASKILNEVGLGEELADRLPEELSGGQKQRLGIARALILNPALLLLDEPVSALDTSVQAGILNLLAKLKEERGLTYLFVSHDLAVVRFLADEIAVLKEGELVEQGATEELLGNPQHEYTRALLEAAKALG